MGVPVLPLRHPDPDDRRRPGGQPRLGPSQLRRSNPDHPPDHRPPGRFFPLTTQPSPTACGRPSRNGSSRASTLPDENEPHHESSNPRWSSGTSNAPTAQLPPTPTTP